MLDQPIVFVDLETTGGSTTADRITEIGIVEVGVDGVSEWSTLVNPHMAIPPFIEKLTGISNDMVKTAPSFAEVAGDLAQRLAGKLFVAHNARFDYGFLKNEFKRLNVTFRADVLCTVKLSRRLYPREYKHNLDSIIARHDLPIEARHRALADARALWLFLRKVEQEQPAELKAAILELIKQPALPPFLDRDVVEDLPESCGVYLMYGENNLPIYVGKSTNIRKRVLQHFGADTQHGKEMQIAQQVRRIDWIETAGELGALLTESRLIKELQPTLNHRLRRNNEMCAWQLQEMEDGFLRPKLVYAQDLDFGWQENLYGLYHSQREAHNTLRKIAEVNQLCLIRLGLETANRKALKPCFAYQLRRCRGACIGREEAGMHNIRLLTALSKVRVQVWPYGTIIALRERDALGARQDLHIVDHWCHLGTVSDEAALQALLASPPKPRFDIDTYKLLTKYLKHAKAEDIVMLNCPVVSVAD
ncbi:DNA polymerase-3 subunit epsilon [Chitinivorax tropicus]|uniref:DNA-directed DNA polymerase n=1 Tax=Chitinivorax tropicus TaxID=714531 RepID=A0A840MFM0_9PROT|nr:exonuclease domain-containing protein [Chitinivorax tropicus]MBB5017200.1 DNA polymerase-3 subunit epsilon [Chitinivorax tropicus]